MEKVLKRKGKGAGSAGFMYYMKPANLSAEIKKYGYDYTVGKTLGSTPHLRWGLPS